MRRRGAQAALVATLCATCALGEALPHRSARVATLPTAATRTHLKPILFRGRAVQARISGALPWPQFILGGISGIFALAQRSTGARVGWAVLGTGLIGWGTWEWRSAPASPSSSLRERLR